MAAQVVLPQAHPQPLRKDLCKRGRVAGIPLRDQRKQHNACGFCGMTGHKRSNCPKLAMALLKGCVGRSS